MSCPEKHIKAIAAVARRTKNSGTKIIVTSPSPPRSGGAKGKDDDRFKHQAAALERLGTRLQAVTFSLHHDGSQP